MGKTAVLLLNVGTPNSPEKRMVRKYLTEFLNDKRVIDLPLIFRKILVNLVIVPFRTSKSTRLYKKLWTEKGSPLRYHGITVANLLQSRLGEGFVVRLAMNYQQPGISAAMDEVILQGVDKIILFPLYPQYASSTTGSAIEKAFSVISRKINIPAVRTIPPYYHHPRYIKAMIARIESSNPSSFDHLLFSFHGLPLRQLNHSHPGKTCLELSCVTDIHSENQFCYQAACYATARAIATNLPLATEKYTVCFQSRIAKKWVAPFTDRVIMEMAQKGVKRLLVVCPSFTADCLETTVEIGMEYHDLFLGHGGIELRLVESLNDSPGWISAIEEIIKEG